MYVALPKKAKPKPRAELSPHVKMQSKSLQDCRNAGCISAQDSDNESHSHSVIMNNSHIVPIDQTHSLNVKMGRESDDEDTEAAVIADDFRAVHVSHHGRSMHKPQDPELSPAQKMVECMMELS